MNENLYQPNVFSGLKSQEITFDFIAANSNGTCIVTFFGGEPLLEFEILKQKIHTDIQDFVNQKDISL